MADAEIRLRLDATQLAAGARRAGAALASLTGRGAGMAAGMRGAAAQATRSASAIDAAGRSARRAAADFAAAPRAGARPAFVQRPRTDPRVDPLARAAVAAGIPSSRVVAAARAAESALTPSARARGGFVITRTPAAVPDPGFARAEQAAGRAATAAQRWGRAGQQAGRQVSRSTTDAAGASRRWGRAGEGAARSVTRGTSGAVEAMRRFERASRQAGRTAQQSMRGAERAAGGIEGRGGLGRMWSLQAAGTQVRMLARGLRDASQQTVDVASERQTARAEMRTVVETESERAMVRTAAREAAAGQGGMVVPITEADFTNAVFAGVASGLSAQAAVNLVPSAANLGLAGQATTAQAQIGLTQLSKFYPEAEFGDLADKIAKTQDMFAFPGGLTELTEGFRGAGAAAQQWRLSLEDQLITQGVFADVGRRGAHGRHGHPHPAGQHGPGLRTARSGRGAQGRRVVRYDSQPARNPGSRAVRSRDGQDLHPSRRHGDNAAARRARQAHCRARRHRRHRCVERCRARRHLRRGHEAARRAH